MLHPEPVVVLLALRFAPLGSATKMFSGGQIWSREELAALRNYFPPFSSYSTSKLH